MLVLSVSLTALSSFYISKSVGQFIAPILFFSLVLPQVVGRSFIQNFVTISIMSASVVSTWLWGANGGWVTWTEVIGCSAVLITWLLAVTGMTRALRLIFDRTFANTVITAVAIAWLTWPVWLSTALPGRLEMVGWLVWAHPLFSINSAVLELGAWSVEPLAYHLTNLGQDVSYQMPETIWPAILLNIMFASLHLIPRAKEHAPAVLATDFSNLPA